MADTNTKTALDVITGALRKIGVYAPGESLSSQDANDALDTFNGLLDIMSNERNSIFNNNETVITLTPGQISYTVGTGGNFNIERPLSIVKSYSRYTTSASTVDFPCDSWTLAQYSKIGLKSQPGPWPKVLYYNMNYPLGEILFWPVPMQSIQFHLWTRDVLANLSLTTLLNMPRGYFLWLQYELAQLLCPEYGMPIPPDISRIALQLKKTVQNTNATPMGETAIDAAVISSAGNDAGFILTGGF